MKIPGEGMSLYCIIHVPASYTTVVNKLQFSF